MRDYIDGHYKVDIERSNTFNIKFLIMVKPNAILKNIENCSSKTILRTLESSVIFIE